MIHPNMGTMLGVICTDASVSKTCLDLALKNAVNTSFNSIDVDGDTSTNDTVLLLANGVAGNAEISDPNSADFLEFQNGLAAVARSLAKQIVQDGEGATKLITIRVTGAHSKQDAIEAAQSIAQSSLVKCAMFGKDPNWGRLYFILLPLFSSPFL